MLHGGRIRILIALGAICCVFVVVSRTMAGAHTWDVNELFSTADGSVWFIELIEADGTDMETGVGGHAVTSGGNMFIIASNVSEPTGGRTLLFANQAFADLCGAPTPDQIVPIDNFFSVNADTITYTPYDSLIFVAGQLPTDGIGSLNMDFSTGPNTPQNYNRDAGTVNANTGLPGVPDGTGGSTPITVTKLDATGSSLSIAWDAATCCDTDDHQVLYGEGSQLPGVPGGVYSLTGNACAIGNVSPFIWNATPNATDGSGLVWWVIAVNDGVGTEGSWGTRDGVNERQGTGPNGSSGLCAVSDKDAAASCGH